MAALKWIVVVLFGLGSAGALAMALTADAKHTPVTRTAPALALRAYPAMPGGAAAAPAPAKEAPVAVAAKEPEKAPEAAKAPEKAPEPAKTPEKAPEPAKTPEKAPEPAKAAEKAPEPAKTPEKAPEPEKQPEAVAKATPPPAPAKPAPTPAPAKPAAAAPAPAAAAAEGLLNLRASDTADVYLDGKKLGGSPLLGVKAKVGAHKVRFDCYDAAGNTVAGAAQTVTVKADAETDIEYPCPTE